MKAHQQYCREAKSEEFNSGSMEGAVAWQSPSNIALIKYWGKREGQFPKNPSLSFTLQHANTSTKMVFRYRLNQKRLRLKYYFHGEENIHFQKRIVSYLNGLEIYFPFLSSLELEVYSENTFPHSSGIASSASSFSALALCLIELEHLLSRKQIDGDHFYKKASFIARLGSGSASRSVYGGINLWGKAKDFVNSSDELAIPIKQDIDPVFHSFQDTILLLDTDVKPLSSTQGHQLMNDNPFAKKRVLQAEDNLNKMHLSMQEADLMTFMDVLEYEALSLHGMMMTSYPGYLLLKPSTIRAIELIRDYRRETSIPLGFTIDAGANLHILYPEKVSDEVKDFIEGQLKTLCVDGKMIFDRVGKGPVKLDIG